MIELELHLEPGNQPQLAAEAWLLSGGDPRRWIEEIASWGIDDQTLTLFVIPTGPADRRAAGLLVVTGRATPKRLPAGLAFGRVAEGFFAPVEARLRPALTEAELRALKPQPTVALHPSLGLLAFGPEDGLRLADLLQGPAERPSQWVEPLPELTPHPRLESIRFRSQEHSLESLFGSEADQIGKKSPDELPPSAGEPSSNPLSRGWHKLQKLFGKSGAGGASPNRFEQLEQWVSQHVEAAARRLALDRNKALQRLLDQLRTNPEEALKWALPLAQLGLHRGVAPPASALGRRNTDFSLNRLGRGGPADFWHTPPDLQAELRRQYLEIAERERRRGRHRRAAYIHAELLADLVTAARVLIEGEHFREAALIYRDHLRQPLEAARWFVRARMLPEAIELYVQAAAFEALGDLYRQLGHEEKAVAAFHRWAAQLVAERRLLQAAAILDERLGLREEALALLESAWPSDSEARRCIERWLTLRGSAGQHEESAKLLRSLGAKPLSTPQRLRLIEIFGALQAGYPDRGVRALGEDLGRREVAGLLKACDDEPGRREALRLLARLAPDDRLLGRDIQRFLDRPKPAPPAKPEPSKREKTVGTTGTHAARLVLLREFHSLRRVQWKKAAGAGAGFCLVGATADGIELVRGNFHGDFHSIRWPAPFVGEQSQLPLLLAATSGPEDRILLGATYGPPFPEQIIPATEALLPARAGFPPWLGDSVQAATFGPHGILWVVHQTPAGRMISGFNADGQFLTHCPAPPIIVPINVALPSETVNQSLAAVGAELLYGAGIGLHRSTALDGALVPAMVQVAEMEAPITALVASPPWGTPHVAVTLATRIAICWLGPHQGNVHLIHVEMEQPVVGFTSDRILVAVSPTEGWLLDCDSRGRMRSAQFPWTGAAPLAVLRGPVARTFSVVDAKGIVRVYGFGADDLK
jgi:hypothetical protein